MLQIKDESGSVEMDIGPITLQNMDSNYRTDQQQYPIVFKTETEFDKSNVDADLCSGVKKEFIGIELMAADRQKTPQATSTAVAAGCVILHQDVCIKDELEDTDLDSGPAAFLYKDSSHRTNQPNMCVVKREDVICRDGNNPVRCDGVEINSVEDKSTDWKSHPYTCNICQKVFPAKNTYRYHVTYMHASKSYKCDQCDKVFKFRWNLNQHKRSLHSIDCYKKCNVCDQYVKLSYLKEHMVNTHSEKQHLSNVCGETVKSEDHLLLHLLDVHGQQPANSNIFTCDYCQRMFTKKKCLRIHVRDTHGKGRYKCNQCEMSYRCEVYLISHKASKHKKCNVCGKSLKPRSMWSHVRHMHGDEQLQCIVCGEKIKSRYYFKQHMNEHRIQPPATATSSQLRRNVPVSGQRLRSKLYSCDKCVQTFTSKDTFRQHHTLSHSTEAEKHNECNVEFKLEFYFHQRTSDDGKVLYECAICKKIYKTKEAMRGHVTNYHRPRPTDSNRPSTCSNIGERSGESTHPHVDEVNAAASASTQQQDAAIKKEDPADEELELGLVVLQHIDRNYRPYKEEPLPD